uniref:Dolichyl-P-Man Man n=1 Tax=Arundo donax TaxID=35708 RepID=A0A0A9CVJ0_ARUDO
MFKHAFAKEQNIKYRACLSFVHLFLDTSKGNLCIILLVLM